MNTKPPFTIEEACSMIDRPVTHKSNIEPKSVSEIGLICGVLKINEEPEVVVKFMEGLKQFTKQEFNSDLRFI